jgi:hypothetical protein
MGHIADLSNLELAVLMLPLTQGFYVDKFVYFYYDPMVKPQFKRLLSHL